jgi:hypothetical protein
MHLNEGAADMRVALGQIWDSQVVVMERAFARGDGDIVVPLRWDQLNDMQQRLFAANMLPFIAQLNGLLSEISKRARGGMN